MILFDWMKKVILLSSEVTHSQLCTFYQTQPSTGGSENKRLDFVYLGPETSWEQFIFLSSYVFSIDQVNLKPY